MTVQYFQRIEAGMNLTLYSLAKIATALNVPITDLFVVPEASSGEPRKRAQRPPRR